MSYQPLNLYSLLFILQLNIFPSFLFYSKYFSSLLAHHLYVFHHSSCTRSHFLFIIIYFPLFLCLSISLFPIIFPCSFFFCSWKFSFVVVEKCKLGYWKNLLISLSTTMCYHISWKIFQEHIVSQVFLKTGWIYSSFLTASSIQTFTRYCIYVQPCK